MQHNRDIEHKEVNIYCATNQFPEFKFIDPHNKPNCVRVLGNNYCMYFDPEPEHGACAMCCIY